MQVYSIMVSMPCVCGAEYTTTAVMVEGERQMDNSIIRILFAMEAMLEESIKAGQVSPPGFPNIREVIAEYREHLGLSRERTVSECELGKFAQNRAGRGGYGN